MQAETGRSRWVLWALLVGSVLVAPWILWNCGTGEASAVPWRTDFGAAIDEARESGKPVLVGFTAAWCPPCKVMKREVWPDPDVGAAAAGYVPVLIDVDAPGNAAVTRRYGVRGIPTILILDAEGRVLREGGFMSRADMIEFLANEA
ncbi:MAG: thioredoxin family protein [Acidobacteria bacterium]|nr:thioredoxin family protein [Acidobacteriota bacterium]